jgi:hypothetical protein
MEQMNELFRKMNEHFENIDLEQFKVVWCNVQKEIEGYPETKIPEWTEEDELVWFETLEKCSLDEPTLPGRDGIPMDTNFLEKNQQEMTRLEQLRSELEPYKDTLVLDLFKVVRLVDVVEDEDDYYWVFDSENGIYHSSCVGMWSPLKGILNNNEYKRLVDIWNLNHINHAK